MLFGVVVWLARTEFLRARIVLTAAVCTAVSGLALAWRGPFVLTADHWLRYVANGLEVGLVGVFLALGICRRIWLVALMAGFQAALLAWEHFTTGHAVPVAPPFVVDPLSLLLVLVITIVGSVIVVHGIGYMRRHAHHAPKTSAANGRFFMVLIGFLGLMNGLVLADSLKWLSVFWEGTTLCSFFLIGHDGTDEAKVSARRALVINAFGGAMLSLGAVLDHRQGGNGLISNLVNTAASAPLVLLLTAAFAKSAQLPFQSWLLGAMVAPTPVSALLHSSTMVKAGSYLVLRLAPAFASTPLALVIAIAGAFTFAATSAMAISQSNAKKVLAYSTIANLGLIVACSGINTPLAYAAALVVLVYHAISKALLFLCVGTIEQQIGSRQIDAMGGIFLKMPLTTTIAALGMFSMMAPPFGMLVGKWMAIVSAGQTPSVLILLVIGSALTIFFWGKWLGRIVTTAYHEKYRIEAVPRSMSIALVLLGVMVLVAGAGVMSVYQVWLRPLAISTLSHVYLQPDSLSLLESVDSFMGWPIILTLAVVVVAGFASFVGLRRTHVRLPYLCGENVVVGTRTFEFRSVMDQRTTAQVTSYYFTHLFGEVVMTRWANLVAILILLSLFARVSLL